MRKVGNMTLYTFEELLDRDLGPIGTPERDAFHAAVKAEVEAEKKAQMRKQAQACKAEGNAGNKVPRTQSLRPRQIDLTPAVG